MTDLIFDKKHALEAIRLAARKGPDWLYQNYRKPNGQMRRSSTGFLMHEGVPYPVKPLGRLANELAGSPMSDNPTTNAFRIHFEKLGFQLIKSSEDEAQKAVERQRRLAGVWERPNQAKFRRAVFEMFGARCLVTGCEVLVALEAAHVLPVSNGGDDEGWNGIPLRADIHRLFDAGVITIDPENWNVVINESLHPYYGKYNGIDLTPIIKNINASRQLEESFHKRTVLLNQMKTDL